MDSDSMEGELATKGHQRKVGCLLLVGIFFLPYIFSWFTLRTGHTPLSRLGAFGWLVALLIFQATNSHSDSQSTSTESASDTATEIIQPDPIQQVDPTPAIAQGNESTGDSKPQEPQAPSEPEIANDKLVSIAEFIKRCELQGKPRIRTDGTYVWEDELTSVSVDKQGNVQGYAGYIYVPPTENGGSEDLKMVLLTKMRLVKNMQILSPSFQSHGFLEWFDLNCKKEGSVFEHGPLIFQIQKWNPGSRNNGSGTTLVYAYTKSAIGL